MEEREKKSPHKQAIPTENVRFAPAVHKSSGEDPH